MLFSIFVHSSPIFPLWLLVIVCQCCWWFPSFTINFFRNQVRAIHVLFFDTCCSWFIKYDRCAIWMSHISVVFFFLLSLGHLNSSHESTSYSFAKSAFFSHNSCRHSFKINSSGTSNHSRVWPVRQMSERERRKYENWLKIPSNYFKTRNAMWERAVNAIQTDHFVQNLDRNVRWKWAAFVCRLEYCFKCKVRTSRRNDGCAIHGDFVLFDFCMSFGQFNDCRVFFSLTNVFFAYGSRDLMVTTHITSWFLAESEENPHHYFPRFNSPIASWL